MRHSGRRSPSEGARGDRTITEPSGSGGLRQGPPNRSSSHGGQSCREQVGHKYCSLCLLLLFSSSQGPAGQPQTDSSRHRNGPLQGSASQGPEWDGEKRHYIWNMGKYTITHWPLYNHSEPQCTDPETEALQDQAACPRLHNGAGVSLRLIRTPSLILASQIGPSR